MTGMTTKGIHKRATDARSAVNRLRWELDLSLGVWPKTHTPTGLDYINATSAIDEIAETIAILRVLLDTIAEKVPERHQSGILFGNIEEKLAQRIAYYINYHQVGR